MSESIALIASATWLLTAVVTGVLGRWVELSGPEKQAVAFILAVLITIAGAYTGFVTGDPVELGLLIIVSLFGANLIHDKLSTPVQELLAPESVDIEERLK